ncbi:hypothetical protein Xbud_01351 [Xenorhabdus budapestensis]|uniref:Uncharacterized protein n=1 Tax=Xenorhabdus budapestensis TaxID=290110 RepID=A0A2D0J1Y3_XENBU|nr:hypothetical protein Xbud_01351 [Xenorhabdus budapestensis]
MRTRTLKQGMQDLVVRIITITGLSPAAVINDSDIMGSIILPAAIDGSRLWWEVRIILCQRFPKPFSCLSRRLMRQQASCGIATGKDKAVSTFAYCFSSQCIMLEGQRRMLVKLKVIQSTRQVIAKVKGIAIDIFAEWASCQAIPFTGNFSSVDTFAGGQTSGFVILIFYYRIVIDSLN